MTDISKITREQARQHRDGTLRLLAWEQHTSHPQLAFVAECDGPRAYQTLTRLARRNGHGVAVCTFEAIR